ncbi:unnamed protein product [Acanthocheilonema viteae]|uniref:Uncharacterized protein n=1 Tax=Acanthocheilonema viteae TaxID=6277 RepID=A0A498SYZ0_ACAVI|nr:unnamed protein product [Acanthocheilonema viteae]
MIREEITQSKEPTHAGKYPTAVERTLRQLETIGENLEQSGIEIAVESKLPSVPNSKFPHGAYICERILITAVPEKPTIKALSRPCALCNKNHWDEECRTYPTLKQRLESLKELNTCCRESREISRIL